MLFSNINDLVFEHNFTITLNLYNYIFFNLNNENGYICPIRFLTIQLF